MSEHSHKTVPYSVENIIAEDFTTILKGIGLSKTEAKKIKDECRHFHMIMNNVMDEIM